ncbi:MAG: peptide chain release factor N(5)-glutamine methyltransferase [Novosphingobium sp.]
MSHTVAEAIRAATERIGPGSDTARLDAELLMAEALDCTRSELFLRRMRDPAPASYAALVERRAAHEPVAYIRGYQEFFGLGFQVTPDVLIPRGDSEVLVEAALAAKPEARRVLDLGTGSGALLLALLSELPEAQGMGIDRSVAALTVATANARALGLAERTRLERRDWTNAGWRDDLGRFDAILCNPPYVEDDADLAPSVRSFEPPGALFAGADGLEDHRLLMPELPALLAPGGIALVEIGHRQAEAVSALAAEAGMEALLHRDLGNRPRALELKISLGKGPASA